MSEPVQGCPRGHDKSTPNCSLILFFLAYEFLLVPSFFILYNEKYPLLCYAPSHHNHAIGESIGIELDMEHYVIFEKNEKK